MKVKPIAAISFFLLRIVASKQSPQNKLLSRHTKRTTTSLPSHQQTPNGEAGKGGILRILSKDILLDRIFDSADTNHDGSINLEEAYALTLKMYVNINRQAPIPPPSKKRVLQLFLNAETVYDGRLNREEFKVLANVLGRRALSRVVAHKLVTLAGPLFVATSVYVITSLG